ncbi:hypothetical protein ACH4TP_38000 [Streptomyces sp. NPDC021012]|uniref:hypothetical protein n=1 Tax=Streptomyces sp. NPDC021012 TaxID=3365107 RepID=UPI00378AAA63
MPEPTHQGPNPFHSGLETHRGRREDCTGPDCGPADDECCGAEYDGFECELEPGHLGAHCDGTFAWAYQPEPAPTSAA